MRQRLEYTKLWVMWAIIFDFEVGGQILKNKKIPCKNQCGKKLFVKPPSPYGPGRRPYPLPLKPYRILTAHKLVSTHLQQPG